MGNRLCSAESPTKEENQKPSCPFFPECRATYLALANTVGWPSVLGPIRQECRSQIQPEAPGKTSPAGGLAQPCPEGN